MRGILITDLSIVNIDTNQQWTDLQMNVCGSKTLKNVYFIWKRKINISLSAFRRYPLYLTLVSSQLKVPTNERLFIHKTYIVTFIAKRSGLNSFCYGTANWKCKRLFLVASTSCEECLL